MKIEDEIKSKFRNEYHKLVVNLMFTSSWLTLLNIKKFKPYGLSTQQFNILRILRGQYPKPATINLLIERMIDKSSNASRLVEKLRLKGLLERHVAKEDRRAVNVIITKKGLDLLAVLDKREENLSEDFPNLSEEEAKQLNNLLNKLRGKE